MQIYICVHTNNVVKLLELNKEDKFSELGEKKLCCVRQNKIYFLKENERKKT